MSTQTREQNCKACKHSASRSRKLCDNCGAKGPFGTDRYTSRDDKWLVMYWNSPSSNHHSADLCPDCKDQLLKRLPKVAEAASVRS